MEHNELSTSLKSVSMFSILIQKADFENTITSQLPLPPLNTKLYMQSKCKNVFLVNNKYSKRTQHCRSHGFTP